MCLARDREIPLTQINDFVTVTNICDTDDRDFFLYRLQPYLLK